MADPIYETCRAMRRDILKMGLAAGAFGSHLGGSLSLVEIMAVLFDGILKYDRHNPSRPERDRLILSKGHGSMALYAALHQHGLGVDDRDIESFLQAGGGLSVHPVRRCENFIEFTGGSLGQGLSFAAGCALVAANSDYYVVLGDGECNEGQVWEAAMFIAHRSLKNITAIIDKNSLQYDGKTGDVLDMGDLKNKWAAFGWLALDVDGHDPLALKQCLVENAQRDRPLAIIARTVKGAGVSFMENEPQWHHKPLGKKQYEKADSEVCGHHA